jgi:hypothetical protein
MRLVVAAEALGIDIPATLLRRADEGDHRSGNFAVCSWNRR